MKNTILAVALTASLLFVDPAAAEPDPGAECNVIGDATCEVESCDQYAEWATMTARQLERAERRLERKNATIARLRQELRDAR